jgi:hypothetical protein
MPRDKENDKRKGKSRVIPDDDDSSVDSKGNLRNLIDYDYDEEEEEDVKRKPRKAALLAKRRVRRMLEVPSESSSSRDTKEEKARKRKTSKKELEKPKLTIEEESSEDEDLETKLAEIQAKMKAKNKSKAKEKPKSKRKVVEESSEEEEEETEEETDEDDEEDEEDDEEEETDDEYDDDEEYDGRRRNKGTLDIVISDLFGENNGRDPNKPQKYNMKKEPASVRRFVELVQKESEDEDNIDTDITYFKSLPVPKQAELLRVLEIKNSPLEVQVPLKFKILEKVTGNSDLSRIAMSKYNALCNIEPSSSEYYKVSHWINGFTGMPLNQYRDIPVKMEDGAEKCGEFMGKVHKCMDNAIYGHDEAKLQIMQFVSSWIANPKSHGNVLSIHGPPGIGKTSLIKDGVAKALDRPFHFITLGGATDASFLDGHSYTYEGSTWGKIVDVLIQSKCMNPVIYFDELDKVSETPKGDEIMNILIHLTDQSQNDRFQDKYFTGIDLDLSRCLFIFSHNNNEKVNPILRDRMYNIAVNGFSMKEKLHIAENYLLVQILKEAGLHEKVSISNEILQHIIENYTGGEQGVRELKRCIQTIISKLNLLRFYNNPKQVPFAIEGFQLPFTLKKSHAELFLKRKEELNASIAHLYT